MWAFGLHSVLVVALFLADTSSLASDPPSRSLEVPWIRAPPVHLDRADARNGGGRNRQLVPDALYCQCQQFFGAWLSVKAAVGVLLHPERVPM